jgi:hypothetical protein
MKQCPAMPPISLGSRPYSSVSASFKMLLFDIRRPSRDADYLSIFTVVYLRTDFHPKLSASEFRAREFWAHRDNELSHCIDTQLSFR